MGSGRPMCFTRELARRHGAARGRRAAPRRWSASAGRRSCVGVDEQITIRLQALEDVDRLEQRRVLHDQGVGLEDRLAQPDLLVVDAAERDDRRAGALRAEARKGLGVLPSRKAATDSSSAAVTTPWPPRPWKRTWNIGLP